MPFHTRRPAALWRSRGSFAASAGGCSGLAAVIIFPMSRTLQGVRHLLGHIGFIVLGEYRVGLEGAACIECAFRHDSLTLAEQIRQHALIIDRDAGLAIGHFET